MEKIRLQKYFTDCGVMSRRAAEREIADGNVKVNGVIAKLGDKVDLGGTFCLGNCQAGVSVMVDDVIHSVSHETVGEFFANEILAKV